AQIKATGNARLRPSGTVRLMKDQSQPVVRYTLVEGNHIFPGTVRDYLANGPDTPPATGHYTLSADIHSGTLELKMDQGIFVKPNGDVELDHKKEEKKSVDVGARTFSFWCSQLACMRWRGGPFPPKARSPWAPRSW